MKNSLIILLALFALVMFSCSKKGCTDRLAVNFDAEAKHNDESCFYNTDSFSLERAGEIEFNGAQVVIPFEFKSKLKIFSVYYEVTHENGFEIEKYEEKGRNWGFPNYGDVFRVDFSQRIWYTFTNEGTFLSYKDVPPLGNLNVYIELRDSLGNGWPFEFEVSVLDNNPPRFNYYLGGESNLDFSDGEVAFLMNQAESFFEIGSIIVSDDFFLQSSRLDCYKEDSTGNQSILFNIKTAYNEYITEPMTEDEFFFGERYSWRIENFDFVPQANNMVAGEKVLFVAKAEDYFGNQLNDTLVVKLKE
jgi:hypothetical protein